jgi:predicted RNase H-like nuclease (RuvC/YqgF family)
MIKTIKRFFAPSYKLKNDNLYDFMLRLQSRIEVLENENTELTNALYELENRLESKIDNFQSSMYTNRTLKNLNLGK